MSKRFKVILAIQACRDLDSIARYIAHDSPNNAADFIDRVLAEIASLDRIPNRLSIATESPIRNRVIRCMVIDEYPVLHHVSTTEVQILRGRQGATLQ